MPKKLNKPEHYIILLIAIGYFGYSLYRLADFPFVHSDEIWLLKLSEQMAQRGSLFVTEPFFDLFPRLPHAIKILYHALQIGWAQFFGFNVVAMRGLTLLASALAVVLFYLLITARGASKWQALLYSALLACNIQFIYMSHFARQEAFILLAQIALYYILERTAYSLKGALLSGLVTGLAIAIHPNSFLLATTFGSILLLRAALSRQIKPLVGYVITVAGFAIVFIGLSLAQAGDFFSRYAALGAAMGTSRTPLAKLTALPIFFYKLYHQISGTYYVPDVRSLFIISALIIIAASIAVKRSKYELAGLAGLTVGLVIIGRYNATSLVFYLPLVILSLARLLESYPLRRQTVLLVVLLSIIGFGSYNELAEPVREDFASFNQKIAQQVAPTDIALANLNQAMALGQFYDYRNLAHLNENDQTIDAYLSEHDIDVIIWSEEMDYIQRNIDDWYILYGKMPYYRDLKRIIAEQFRAVDSFDSPLYGCRIYKYQDGYPWRITIYRRIE